MATAAQPPGRPASTLPWTALGLLAVMAFCLAGPRISRHLPPATATIMLVLGGVCVAGATAVC